MDQGLAEVSHFLATEHSLIPIMLLLPSFLFLVDSLFPLFVFHVLLPFLLEALVVEVELFSDELASQGV